MKAGTLVMVIVVILIAFGFVLNSYLDLLEEVQ